MCKAPLTLPDGKQIACRKCSLCADRIINDWVGRNIAESKTAVASHAVTLTYGRNSVNEKDHERAVLLTYSDVQRYLKLLRRHGYPVRYFVTGEFGTLKGRAHWHIMLYWQDKVPQVPLNRVTMEAHWPHGWSFWTEPTFHAIRYNCKYLLKGNADGRQGHLAMSKKPPLGTQYFRELAEEYVRQGVAPQTPEYRFPGVTRKKKDGTQEVIPFWLKDRPLEMFLEHFVQTWRRIYPGRHLPNSELGEEYLDPGAWRERVESLKPWVDPPPQPEGPRKVIIRDDYEWWIEYVGSAQNGEERQRRENEFRGWEIHRDTERQRFAAQYADCEPDADGGGAVTHYRSDESATQHGHESDHAAKSGNVQRPHLDSGKVGRWNTLYPKQPGNPGPGS